MAAVASRVNPARRAGRRVTRDRPARRRRPSWPAARSAPPSGRARSAPGAVGRAVVGEDPQAQRAPPVLAELERQRGQRAVVVLGERPTGRRSSWPASVSASAHSAVWNTQRGGSVDQQPPPGGPDRVPPARAPQDRRAHGGRRYPLADVVPRPTADRLSGVAGVGAPVAVGRQVDQRQAHGRHQPLDDQVHDEDVPHRRPRQREGVVGQERQRPERAARRRWRCRAGRSPRC